MSPSPYMLLSKDELVERVKLLQETVNTQSRIIEVQGENKKTLRETIELQKETISIQEGMINLMMEKLGIDLDEVESSD